MRKRRFSVVSYAFNVRGKQLLNPKRQPNNIGVNTAQQIFKVCCVFLFVLFLRKTSHFTTSEV